jgi:hypothetical protein
MQRDAASRQIPLYTAESQAESVLKRFVFKEQFR